MTLDNDNLRKRSNSVNIDSKLTSFLYSLLRDHVAPSVLEKLVREIEHFGGTTEYTNGWLALYADDLRQRLEDSDANAAKVKAMLAAERRNSDYWQEQKLRDPNAMLLQTLGKVTQQRDDALSILDPRREPDDNDMPAPESTDKEGMWRLGWRGGWIAACSELAKITETK